MLIRSHGEEIDKLIEGGSVRPLVGQRFPLEQAADALEAARQPPGTGESRARRPPVVVSRGGRQRGSRRPSRG